MGRAGTGWRGTNRPPARPPGETGAEMPNTAGGMVWSDAIADPRRAVVPVTDPDAPNGGWPSGMPYTVAFPDGDGYIEADLEHHAPLPRVGDTIEYVDEAGDAHRYRVREVIHTIQSSASHRPAVDEGTATPNAFARLGDERAERPGEGGLVRTGLPKVVLEERDGAPDAEPIFGARCR
jgi:hypothetical protein